MKVTDLRRKLLASLAAGGLLAPGAAYAANLNENLVVNGGFETVDLATTSTYNSPLILNWLGGQGFAYSHDGSMSNAGVVPDFADGFDPPNPGHWYFTPNVSAPEITGPGEFYQDINVAGGATGTEIAAGTADFSVSAYMSSYDTNNDYGNLHVDFRNGGGSLGTALFSDTDPGPNNVWSLVYGSGAVPVGTTTVRLSIYGTALDAGPDGYIDNVDFRITDFLPALSVTVDRADGSIELTNNTGAAVNLSSYSITSAFEALAPASWLSVADNYDSGNPGPNQVDAAHAWSELTDPNAHTDLSEADLQAGTGASLAQGRTVNLSNANAWIRTSTEDLIFQYVSNGQVFEGIVNYIGNGDQSFEFGDINTSGAINQADWVTFRTNQHADLSSLSLAEAYRSGDLTGDKQNNHADFIAFKAAYDAANGAGSFVAMVSSIPEPASVLLVMMSGLCAVPLLRRCRRGK
jgi:hypothetical protein